MGNPLSIPVVNLKTKGVFQEMIIIIIIINVIVLVRSSSEFWI